MPTVNANPAAPRTRGGETSARSVGTPASTSPHAAPMSARPTTSGAAGDGGSAVSAAPPSARASAASSVARRPKRSSEMRGRSWLSSW